MAAVVIVSPVRAASFVGLVAEDIAQVRDRRAELRKRCGQGTERETRRWWPPLGSVRAGRRGRRA